MHRFTVRQGELFCEEVPVARAAQRFGTPLYLYSLGTLLDHYRKIKTAFASLKPLICFSVKANGNLALLRALVKAGAGLDIVSGGELFKARRTGCPPERIVYASVGKRPDEIREALRTGILCFNVESPAELEALEREAGRLGVQARVALRVNPDVEPHTHRYITTGTAQNKFGIPMKTAERLILREWNSYPHLRLMGFHVHVGSQITRATPFLKAVERVGKLITRTRRQGQAAEWLNLGGGLGIVYKDERPQTAAAFAQAILPALKRLRVRLILEPGRFIAGNAGILVTRVLYIKTGGRKRFAIVDAGMNDLLRPALYGAYHDIRPVRDSRRRRKRVRGGGKLRYDVVGPVCESGDFFGRNRALPPLQPGDLLAVMGTGAYGFTMASHYNARPNPPEVLVREKRLFRVRRRETVQDLIRGETIPAFLK